MMSRSVGPRVTEVDEDSDGFSSVGVTRRSSRKRHKKKRMKKSMSKIKDILGSISDNWISIKVLRKEEHLPYLK